MNLNLLRSALLSFSIFIFSIAANAQKKQSFQGTFSNGYKGAKISFTVSADGKKLQDLTFDGYWRCASGIEQTKVGPNKSFPIINGKVDGVVTDPKNGGSTAWRFELNGTIAGGKAQGTFRMNINNLGCDTYEFKWTATGK